jgi:hypothetical protein
MAQSTNSIHSSADVQHATPLPNADHSSSCFSPCGSAEFRRIVSTSSHDFSRLTGLMCARTSSMYAGFTALTAISSFTSPCSSNRSCH